MRFIDKTGLRYGKLVVAGIDHHGTAAGVPRIFWKCHCDCGETSVVLGTNLKASARSTKSCGCEREKRKTTHGLSKLREYRIWAGMIQRCTNPNSTRYSDYGGRGIAVCSSWLKFENFYLDMGKRPAAHLSIDRVKNNEGYSKQNCKWSTRSEQQLNKRTTKCK